MNFVSGNARVDSPRIHGEENAGTKSRLCPVLCIKSVKIKAPEYSGTGTASVVSISATK